MIDSIDSMSDAMLISREDATKAGLKTYDNYGEWHIDHIKPVSVFIREGESRPCVVHALSNLQPLWAADSLSKSSKYGGCTS